MAYKSAHTVGLWNSFARMTLVPHSCIGKNRLQNWSQEQSVYSSFEDWNLDMWGLESRCIDNEQKQCFLKLFRLLPDKYQGVWL